MSVININTKRPDRIWELLADSPVGSQLMRIADQLFGEVADTMAYAWTLDRDNHLAALRDELHIRMAPDFGDAQVQAQYRDAGDRALVAWSRVAEVERN